jgi:hypothetical protein
MRPLYQRPIAGQKTRTCRHDQEKFIHLAQLKPHAHLEPVTSASGNVWIPKYGSTALPHAPASKAPAVTGTGQACALSNAMSPKCVSQPHALQCQQQCKSATLPRRSPVHSIQPPSKPLHGRRGPAATLPGHAAAAAGARGPQLGRVRALPLPRRATAWSRRRKCRRQGRGRCPTRCSTAEDRCGSVSVFAQWTR